MAATRSMTPANRRLAANVRKLRCDAGLTQVELASKLGIMQKSVSEIERGVLNPRTDTLDRIAEFFEIDVAKLLEEIPDAAA